jgi:hypothetical protein
LKSEEWIGVYISHNLCIKKVRTIELLNKYSLIAPCGMNCGICRAYLKENNKYKIGIQRVLVRCPGCRGTESGKPKYCAGCKIKNCGIFKNNGAKYCFECGKFPCDRVKRLDKRYRTNYNMSMIENLEYIRDYGIRKFVKNEEARWTCSRCGGTVCVHDKFCVECGGKNERE